MSEDVLQKWLGKGYHQSYFGHPVILIQKAIRTSKNSGFIQNFEF